jgi:hypothetical protein
MRSVHFLRGPLPTDGVHLGLVTTLLCLLWYQITFLCVPIPLRFFDHWLVTSTPCHPPKLLMGINVGQLVMERDVRVTSSFLIDA